MVASLGPVDAFGERPQIDTRPFPLHVDQSPRFALDIMGALTSRLREYGHREVVTSGGQLLSHLLTEEPRSFPPVGDCAGGSIGR